MTTERHMPELVALMTDPLRHAIVTALTLEAASVADLAAQLDVPAERVRYQIKRLRQTGIVEVHGQRERRGAREHTYIANSRRATYSTENALLDPDNPWKKHGLAMLRVMFGEAVEATRAGAFRDRDDYFVVRIPMRLDEKGFSEVSEIYDAALEGLFTLREKCLARLEQGNEESNPAMSLLFFYEVSA
jgi:DNA-binding transcriptional ArsR family regulator